MICGMYLGLLGPISPLMVMSGAMALLYLKPTAYLDVLKAWPLLLVAALGPLSALWSDEPAVSFRYGLQLAITIVSVMIAVSAAGATRYLKSIFIATSIILVLSLVSGRQGQSVAGPVLIGILGSKNAMGALCMLSVCASLSIMMSSSQPPALRYMSAAMAALAGAVLVKTAASGAALGTIMFVGVAATMVVASRLPRGSVWVATLLLMMLLLPLWLVRDEIVSLWEWFILDVLGKDTGLTGRDYLWAHADALIAEKPILGRGYRSIWLGQGYETIGLLRWAGLQSGAGFNFHNTPRDILVDFGFVGAIVIFGAIGVGVARLVARAITQPTNAALIFLAAIATVSAIRSVFETLIGTFSDSSLMLIGPPMFGYLMSQTRPVASRARRRLTDGALAMRRAKAFNR
jgi:exopolysaccharide production protein ExoQ